MCGAGCGAVSPRTCAATVVLASPSPAAARLDGFYLYFYRYVLRKQQPLPLDIDFSLGDTLDRLGYASGRRLEVALWFSFRLFCPAPLFMSSSSMSPGSPDTPFPDTLEEADKAVADYEAIQRQKLERRLGISSTVCLVEKRVGQNEPDAESPVCLSSPYLSLLDHRPTMAKVEVTGKRCRWTATIATTTTTTSPEKGRPGVRCVQAARLSRLSRRCFSRP